MLHIRGVVGAGERRLAMDIVMAIVLVLAAKIMLFILKHQDKPKKKREPLGAFLFGSWYYWHKANRAPANR